MISALMFGALFLTTNTMLVGGLVVLGAILAALLWYRLDDKIERRRETAIEVHAFFADLTLEETAEMCKHYAIGDYDGVARDFVQIAKIVANPEKRMIAVRKAGLKIASMLAEDDAEYAKLLDVIQKERMHKEPLAIEFDAAAKLLDVELED